MLGLGLDGRLVDLKSNEVSLHFGVDVRILALGKSLDSCRILGGSSI